MRRRSSCSIQVSRHNLALALVEPLRSEGQAEGRRPPPPRPAAALARPRVAGQILAAARPAEHYPVLSALVEPYNQSEYWRLASPPRNRL